MTTVHTFHVAGCLIFMACAHSQLRELVPAAVARPASHVEAAAMDEDFGVALIARADEALGRANALVPFQIWLHNGSGRPLQIRMSSFVLTTADGSHYRAVPLWPAQNPSTSSPIEAPR